MRFFVEFNRANSNTLSALALPPAISAKHLPRLPAASSVVPLTFNHASWSPRGSFYLTKPVESDVALINFGSTHDKLGEISTAGIRGN